MSAYAFSTTQCVSSKAVRANAATSRAQAPSLSPRRRQPRSVGGGGGINKHVGHHQRQRRHALIPPSHASTSTYEDITEAEQAAEAVAKAVREKSFLFLRSCLASSTTSMSTPTTPTTSLAHNLNRPRLSLSLSFSRVRARSKTHHPQNIKKTVPRRTL